MVPSHSSGERNGRGPPGLLAGHWVGHHQPLRRDLTERVGQLVLEAASERERTDLHHSRSLVGRNPIRDARLRNLRRRSPRYQPDMPSAQPQVIRLNRSHAAGIHLSTDGIPPPRKSMPLLSSAPGQEARHPRHAEHPSHAENEHVRHCQWRHPFGPTRS